MSGYNPRPARRPRSRSSKEKLCVGGSILHVRRVNGRWERVPASEFTRRFTALYPDIAADGPGVDVPAATGTLANCSGGRTPWFTALSCEENFQDYNADDRPDGLPLVRRRRASASTNGSTAGSWRSIPSARCRR